MVQDASEQSSSNSGQQHRGCRGATTVQDLQQQRLHGSIPCRFGVEDMWLAYELIFGV